MASSALAVPLAQKPLERLDLLQGFKHFLQMIDRSCGYFVDSLVIGEAKKLVGDYFRVFKRTNSELVNSVSWDEIIDATKESSFFQHYPGFLLEVNPDLKYKPGPEYPALREFAQGRISVATAAKVVEELRKMGIGDKKINTTRIAALSGSLKDYETPFDGWQTPYRLLLPFISLACARLQGYAYDDHYQESYLDRAYFDAFADAESLISITDIQEMRNN